MASMSRCTPIPVVTTCDDFGEGTPQFFADATKRGFHQQFHEPRRAAENPVVTQLHSRAVRSLKRSVKSVELTTNRLLYQRL
jgi:hypothetical protein